MPLAPCIDSDTLQDFDMAALPSPYCLTCLKVVHYCYVIEITYKFYLMHFQFLRHIHSFELHNLHKQIG